MKFQNLLKAMLVIVFSIILVSCAKTEKQRIINFNNDVIEWFNGKTFMTDMKAQVKTPDQMTKFLSTNIGRIAKQNGFKDEKETEIAFKKLENDADIKKLMTETESKVKSRLTGIVIQIGHSPVLISFGQGSTYLKYLRLSSELRRTLPI